MSEGVTKAPKKRSSCILLKVSMAKDCSDDSCDGGAVDYATKNLVAFISCRPISIYFKKG